MIGIFDSGVGGLSVLKEIRKELPDQGLIYLADQIHVPYGPRTLAEVRDFSVAITNYLLGLGAGLIVVACNTASAAALNHLRKIYPQIPFVGMEPAVKPAAEQTISGKVGVLATPATFQGALYASVVERFAAGVTIFQDTCPGLVEQIELGRLEDDGTYAILEKSVRPMLAHNIDTIVLGCTHYPFVIPAIKKIAGPSVRVIDPAPAVARQVRRVLEKKNQSKNIQGIDYNTTVATVRILTTGVPAALEELLPTLLGQQLEAKWVEWSLLETLNREESTKKVSQRTGQINL